MKEGPGEGEGRGSNGGKKNSVLSLPPGLSLPEDPATEPAAKMSHSRVCGKFASRETRRRSNPHPNWPPRATRQRGKKVQVEESESLPCGSPFNYYLLL